ncbi:MAG: tRNA (N6-isopentenyl adenosine(37)-C2)-methylthiotransferase MiaB [Bdellovibrionales bacterium]|nr:tRNA (N6-isopentenyl adenosine(37)-C2)-methylthiotransferase MiaB [Bdellovibrionales bacterium]
MYKQSIYIQTYGCQMNDYESDRTYRMFHENFGYTWISDPQKANLVVFNTCSIREKADQKAFSTLGKLREAKAARHDMVIAVGGCLAQSQGQDIKKRFPFVDIVFGTHQWANLPVLVQKVKEERRTFSELDLFGWQNYAFLPNQKSNLSYPVSDLLTIQNGCDKFCTFCLVPFTRGRQVSRTPKDVLEEAKAMVAKGVRELTLLGQNVNAYGVDRSGEITFAELLRQLSNIRDLKRLRFVTSHPSELTKETIDVMAESENICEHLHLPIQSGSNKVLQRMNRDYTVEKIEDLLGYLKHKIPEIALTTDIIVGFPGETENDFELTLAAMKKFEFDDSYSFCFSPRPNTKASNWKDEFVELKVAKERLYRLQTLQKEMSNSLRSQWVGRNVEVLVEGRSKREPDELTGKTRRNQSINFACAQDLTGQLVDVKISALIANTFKGEVLNNISLPVLVA